ncbi:metal ABC transporter substrate-binding protein [Treponema zioleckii]|uniref:metal ABC transporter substrate-binding protein n=1 Tax=Treponema zioleckii TaxID=331680 RepID=UPI002412EFE1|nr:metal ABC transporter substrate-binding protein [Treponema zioleckii]
MLLNEKKLDALDSKYSAAVKNGSKNTLLFGDRFPFRYLVDDYGLKYYAAFVGCSAESEASFKTVVFLAQKLNELGLNYVLQIESSDGKIAKTVISARQKTKKQKS